MCKGRASGGERERARADKEEEEEERIALSIGIRSTTLLLLQFFIKSLEIGCIVSLECMDIVCMIYWDF